MANVKLFLLLLVSVSLYTQSESLWGFSSKNALPSEKERKGMIDDFKKRAQNNGGKELVEMESRILGPTSSDCWHEAYWRLYTSCNDIMGDTEKRYRLAWHLSSCFVQDSGKAPLPFCDDNMPMVACRKKLTDFHEGTFRDFFNQANHLCHQLQAETFQHRTDRLMNGLLRLVDSAVNKLGTIIDLTYQIFQETNEVHDSLASIEHQTQQLKEKSGDIDIKMNNILDHAQGIENSQIELKEGQLNIKEKIESGIDLIEEAYEKLGDGMERLSNETAGLEKEIKSVGENMSSMMQNIQSTTNDIGLLANESLERQSKVLDGQEAALESLEYLRRSQSQALKESRETVERLAELGKKQQEDLLKRQELIKQNHDRMVQNLNAILAAQEEFGQNQALIFSNVDKLLKVLNAILVESRFIKSFFYYSCVIYFLYMLTSAKQTYAIRGQLYFELCIALVFELGIKFGESYLDKQLWIVSDIFWVRSTFLLAASIQILYSVFTFRDYDILNHQLLQTLVNKVGVIEGSSEESDDSLSGYSWLCEELPDEVDSKLDPDYAFPEQVGENFTTSASLNRRYNLRPR
ncbi:gamete expressed protein 1 [Carex rostrata]